jgi:hypothetical protein
VLSTTVPGNSLSAGAGVEKISAPQQGGAGVFGAGEGETADMKMSEPILCWMSPLILIGRFR